MSPPLPVPSKAALHALRGLALGSSCAIGLIIEDRRRRITTLSTAVENKKKLEASRQYHHQTTLDSLAWQLADVNTIAPGIQSEQTAGCLETRPDEGTRDHVVLEAANRSQEHNYAIPSKPTQLPIPQPPSSQQSGCSTIQKQIRLSLAEQAAHKSPTNQATERQQSIKALLFQGEQTLAIGMIETLLSAPSPRAIHQAVLVFGTHFSQRCAKDPSLFERWNKVLIRLSRECQTNGRWDDASRILAAVVDCGPMEESQFFAYNPIPTLRILLLRGHKSDTLCSENAFNTACRSFTAKLTGPPEDRGTGMEPVGRLLMLEAFARERPNMVSKIYLRTLAWAKYPEPFVRWAIEKAFEYKQPKLVVNFFVRQYCHTEPPRHNYRRIIQHVIDSVVELKGDGTIAVLAGLARIKLPEGEKLLSPWIVDLLKVSWSYYHDVAKAAEFLDKAIALGVLEKIHHPQLVHYALIEIAAKAGNESMASTYADYVIRSYPAMKETINLKLATIKAGTRDWDQTFQTFREVERDALPAQNAFDTAFRVALKEYAAVHSAAETRDFAMRGVEELGVKFHRHMVTMVAKRFGQCRDMKGFVDWLKESSRHGFALDPGFCNVLLYYCWATWKLSFKELRELYSELKALNPNCSDKVTARILNQAAIRNRKRVSNAQYRVRFRTVALDEMALRGKSTNQRDILEAMNQHMALRNPSFALHVYKRAMQLGMTFCIHCHSTAVLAACRLGKRDTSEALSLIKEAYYEGHDVQHAVGNLIKWHMDRFAGDAEDAVTLVRNLIVQFESAGVVIVPSALTHIAALCVNVDEVDRAISLCNLARDRSGSPHLCFSLESITTLASAYTSRLDSKAMKSLLEDLLNTRFVAEKAVLLHIKLIRNRVRRMNESAARTSFLETVERGVEQIRQARLGARAQGMFISEHALRIVGDALASMQNHKEMQMLEWQ